MNLSIVLPAYNEADNLSKLIPRIKENVEKIRNINYEILIIDTQKPMDNTPDICGQYSAKYIPRCGGNNYGDAIRTGIKEAKGEYMLIMDADGSHNPEDIVRLYDTAVANEAGVVIGSRYTEGGKTYNGLVLRLMSYALNVVYSFVFSLGIKDVSDSFRVYRTELIKHINTSCDNFDIVEEVIIKLRRKFPQHKIMEIPITFQKRDQGYSKRNLGKFILSYLVTMVKLWRIRNEF